MSARTERNAVEYKQLRARALLFSLFIAVLLVIAAYAFVFMGVQVTDGGMSPTLSAGDVLIFNRLEKHLSAPKRGDILLYEEDGAMFIGRVVALPYETVQTQGGEVYIGGIYLDESAYRATAALSDFGPITLEKNTYLLLPDQRSELTLSGRAPLMELAVDITAIRGEALLRVSPYGKISLF
jgi:signal peptidase I